MSQVGTTNISADAGGRKGEEGEGNTGSVLLYIRGKGDPGRGVGAYLPFSTFLAAV